MGQIDNPGFIDDAEYAAIQVLTREQDAQRREADAALRAQAGLPCPLCQQIDNPLPGTPPLRLALKRRHKRLLLTCPRQHEFDQALSLS